jgi:hypothetical protein
MLEQLIKVNRPYPLCPLCPFVAIPGDTFSRRAGEVLPGCKMALPGFQKT